MRYFLARLLYSSSPFISELSKVRTCVCCWYGQTRAAILTASQLASYSEVKAMTKQLTGWEDGLALHISCSMVAGLVSTTATSPGARDQEHGPVWSGGPEACMLLFN